MRVSFLAAPALLAALLPACRSSASAKPSAAPLEPGCAVHTFSGNPSYQTESVGFVRATCDSFVANEDCLRELKDQACKLGADTIWGIGDGPSHEGGKTSYSGRAARRK